MRDPLANRAVSTSGPETDIVPITPNDTIDLNEVEMALFIETGGTFRIVTRRGETRMRDVEVYDQTLLPVAVRRVMAPGTTATGVHALVVG